MLKIKPSTVYAWAEQGKIPHFKLNGALRFSGDDVAAWVHGNYKSPESCIMPSGGRPRKGGKR
jgi:excisionase family DNA binding protein